MSGIGRMITIKQGRREGGREGGRARREKVHYTRGLGGREDRGKRSSGRVSFIYYSF
jgi:hypothetical protein